MSYLCGEYVQASEAHQAREALIQHGFEAGAVSVEEEALGTCTLRVDLTQPSVALDVVEAILHKHHAARVYGNPTDRQPVEPMPGDVAPSTGTYQVHSPVGGNEHGVDPTDIQVSSSETPVVADSTVLLDATRPADQAL